MFFRSSKPPADVARFLLPLANSLSEDLRVNGPGEATLIDITFVVDVALKRMKRRYDKFCVF